MRNNNRKGFTLIELLIVIAIIGILAAVLIPNLLNARARAFDTAAQSCLRSIATVYEVQATNSPFEYRAFDDADTAAVASSCNGITPAHTVSATAFTVTAQHPNGSTQYTVSNGTGVVPVAAGE